MADVKEAKHTGISVVADTPPKTRNIATDLLSAYAISGCNTVDGYFGIGKETFNQMLNAG
ncbi:hypothetical protein DPMN_008471, partial [Dreissena polymorpha]